MSWYLIKDSKKDTMLWYDDACLIKYALGKLQEDQNLKLLTTIKGPDPTLEERETLEQIHKD